MLSPFGELKDCVVIIDKMSQKSKVRLGIDTQTWAEHRLPPIGAVAASSSILQTIADLQGLSLMRIS